MKILLLEDDTILAETLKELLEDEGFSVDQAYNAEETYELTYNNRYDLYIFDINLPDESGIEVLKKLKAADDNTPTIYITALTDLSTIAKAFDTGAVDYIKKPFDFEEFLIRVKSRLPSRITYKNIELDLDTNIVKKDGEIISLGHIQLEILKKLLTNRGKIVNKEELMEYLEHQNDNALRVMINKLKTKLDIPITSVRSKGYIIE
jgi:DNA-binding response OmpR family regulator